MAAPPNTTAAAFVPTEGLPASPGVAADSHIGLAPLLRLTKALRGYARFIIVQDPFDWKQYTIGMRHVLETQGSRMLLAELKKNVYRTHKRHLQGRLCSSVVEGRPCPNGQECPYIHITPVGYAERRPWIDRSQRTRGRAANSPSADLGGGNGNGDADHFPAPGILGDCHQPPPPPPPPLSPSPTASNDGGESSVPVPEFRPCGPYLPSPYVTAPHPSPYRPIIPPFLHENGSLHEDLTVAQQRTQQTRHRLRTNVDGILAQTPPVGPPGAMRPGPHPHGPPQVFPAAGPYAPSYYHSISHPPHLNNRSAPYSVWVPPPHMGPS